MNIEEIDIFKVSIEVEADRTCSVRASSMHSFEFGPSRGKITGLTPEVATELKTALEAAFAFGRVKALSKLHHHINTELGRRG